MSLLTGPGLSHLKYVYEEDNPELTEADRAAYAASADQLTQDEQAAYATAAQDLAKEQNVAPAPRAANEPSGLMSHFSWWPRTEAALSGLLKSMTFWAHSEDALAEKYPGYVPARKQTRAIAEPGDATPGATP
jgi:hypothetical protein